MKICVFCSSGNDIAESYKQSAFRLGKTLAEQGHTLVYGGATGGLMDAVAEGAAWASGEIIGIIPEAIVRNKRLSALPTTLIHTPDMNERKKQMLAMSDVFVVLPGSYGTLDEMFGVIAAGMVGEHTKPLFCVNENGFYTRLLAHLHFMQAQCSTAKSAHYQPVFVKSTEECVEKIKNLML